MIAEIVLEIAVLAVFVGTAVVNWLKGKRLWAVLGFITGWHVIPAFRLAKPSSWWARRFYDSERMGQAAERFPDKELLKGAAGAH